ncbi:MAG: rhodanese, partial [Rhodocyclaceae bacterium]|nr:rhodanese [Rhodocyclaceae bacterium]
KSGDAFGEEALVADAPRNASVRMTRDGVLYRLEKNAFKELLRDPLLKYVDFDTARAMAARGAQWLDVRFPAEFLGAHLPGAINLPLGEVRNAFQSLDRQRTYLVCCQSGRRSSAAAFLLAQHGFDAYLLKGGLPHMDPTGSKH